MAGRSMKTTTSQQFELLISEIVKNPELAQRTAKLKHFESRGKWEEIATKLNYIGPPERSLSEWKKVYFDMRSRVKRKYDENKSGKYAEIPLTTVEKKLLRALQLNEAVKRKYKSPSPELPTVTRRSNRHSPENFSSVEIKLETNSPTSSVSASPTPLSPSYRKSTVQSPTLICGQQSAMPPASAPTSAKVPKKENKTFSKLPENNLFRRQLQNQSDYLDMTRNLVEVMSSQKECLAELSKTAQIHAKLMEQQVVLLEKQAVAMERQAAALERMANL